MEQTFEPVFAATWSTSCTSSYSRTSDHQVSTASERGDRESPEHDQLRRELGSIPHHHAHLDALAHLVRALKCHVFLGRDLESLADDHLHARAAPLACADTLHRQTPITDERHQRQVAAPINCAHTTLFCVFRIDAIGLIPAFTTSFFHCIVLIAFAVKRSQCSPAAASATRSSVHPLETRRATGTVRIRAAHLRLSAQVPARRSSGRSPDLHLRCHHW